MPTTGMELKLQRVEAMIKLQDLAAQMGRSRAAVHRYEGLRVVSEDVAVRYLGALSTLRYVADDPDGNDAPGHGVAA